MVDIGFALKNIPLNENASILRSTRHRGSTSALNQFSLISNFIGGK